MASERGNLKRFYAGLLLPLLLLALLCGASLLVLVKSGEYLSLDEIITRQEKNGGLYGSALFQRAFHYKQRLYHHVRPEVVTLGSSRVLQFREDDFSSSFVNLGSMSDLDELIELSSGVFDAHKPKLIILGVDFWWFHPQAEKAFVNRSAAEVKPAPRDFFEPFSWLIRDKISAENIETLLRGKTPHIGISAITRGDGYSMDGSYHYTSTLTGTAPSDDPRFLASLAKIKKGEKIYAHGDRISQLQWKKFQELLIRLDERDIPVILLVPPLAPATSAAMSESGKYKYVADLRWTLERMAAERNIPYFDFHDASSIGAIDCEFIDGHHGGPVVYQRLLLNMAVANESLRKAVKLPEIGWNIQNYGGQASLRADEKDFLDIGCVKK